MLEVDQERRVSGAELQGFSDAVAERSDEVDGKIEDFPRQLEEHQASPPLLSETEKDD